MTSMPPKALIDDPEEVSWALDIARGLYQQGELESALMWLRRAAQSAAVAELDDRAVELAEAAQVFVEQLRAEAPPPRPRKRTTSGTMARPSTPSVAPPRRKTQPPAAMVERPTKVPGAMAERPTKVPGAMAERPTKVPPAARRPSELPAATRGRKSSRALDAVAAGTPSRRRPSLPPAPVLSAETKLALAALRRCRRFNRMPEVLRVQLAECAETLRYAPGESVELAGMVLVRSGSVSVSALVSDHVMVNLQPGSVLISQGTLAVPLTLRCAAVDSVQLFRWQVPDLWAILLDAPGVAHSLQMHADPVVAACGLSLGPLVETLGTEVIDQVLSRAKLVRLAPREVWARAGKPLPGVVLLGAGSLLHGEQRFRMGEVVLAERALGSLALELPLGASDEGALFWVVPRQVIYELGAHTPALLEQLIGD